MEWFAAIQLLFWGQWTGVQALEGAYAPAEPLVWQSSPTYETARIEVPTEGEPGFTLLPTEHVGIQFTNTLSIQRALKNHNLMNGAGVAAGDYDGDGWTDLYFCSVGGHNALYRNLGGWRFADVTETAGVACEDMSSTGSVFADVNGDGHLDLLVASCGGPNALLMNDGEGRFQDVTEEAGLVSRRGSTSLALADIDADGDLDLYVANYGATSILRTGGNVNVKYVNGEPVIRGRYARRIKIVDGQMMEMGEPDALYINDGTGNFEEVSWTGGAFLKANGQPLEEVPWDMGLSAMFRDVNRDGLPDLYVCNDFQTPDWFWINQGDGRFQAVDPFVYRSSSRFSMAVDFADVNRDNAVDFFVADMRSRRHDLRMTQMGVTNPPPQQIGEFANRPQIRRNTLLLNRGDDTFADIANYSGVEASEWTWAAAFLDVDLDGYEDLLIANGHAFDTQDIDTMEATARLGRQSVSESRRNLLRFPPLKTSNLIFRNRGDLTFEETGEQWGFHSELVSHGVALSDLDNDGDLDPVLNCLNASPLVYRNNSSAPRIGVRLQGESSNAQGIGARITVLGGPVRQSQEVICGGRYLSGDDPMRVFAAGTTDNDLTIKVRWPDGRQSVVKRAKPNRLYRIKKSGAVDVSEAEPKRVAESSATLFQDVSDRLGHVHHEPSYDDFARQPLLPWRLSRLGPGTGWSDLDGDGDDDLILGSGRGGSIAVYRNEGQGRFNHWDAEALQTKVPDDLTTLLGGTLSEGTQSILAGLAHYETGDARQPAVLQYQFEQGVWKKGAGMAMPAWEDSESTGPGSPGPMAMADVDGDGDLDLFLGERSLPGRYPEPVSGWLFRNENGELELDRERSRTWRGVGLISGAVFSDLTGDGWPELILACEWGPIRIYHNRQGVFEEATRPWGIAKYTGWWTGVTTGDLNGDGRMDIIAGNRGLNSLRECSVQRPIALYYGQFNQDPALDMLEAYSPPGWERMMPWRQMLELDNNLPFLRQRFENHVEYAEADVREVLGDRYEQAEKLEVNTLASMVFFNRGDHFSPQPLPPQAQWAPVFGINVGDMNGDGYQDLFLGQNFFATQRLDNRLDAGRGLLLQGDGTGNLQAVPGQNSGIQVWGEQRGSALSDFDGDGRLDLVVTQNGAETKLYRNSGGKPGIRLRLEGPASNPDGIGAVVRLEHDAGWGPAQEIKSGSGYWSQESPVILLHWPKGTTPKTVQVRWPGGQTEDYSIPKDAREITANWEGEITKGT